MAGSQVMQALSGATGALDHHLPKEPNPVPFLDSFAKRDTGLAVLVRKPAETHDAGASGLTRFYTYTDRTRRLPGLQCMTSICV